jgi:hypothetical protein
MQFVERSAGERGRDVQAQHRQGVVEALAQARRRAGVGTVEFFG